MNNFHYKKAAFFCCILFLSSCDHSVLDAGDDQNISDEQIWQNELLINFYLNDLYAKMGHGLHEVMLASLSDDSHFIHGDGTVTTVMSQLTPGSLGIWGGGNGNGDFAHLSWGALFKQIRSVNVMIREIDDSAIQNVTLRNEMKGEAHFIRAYYYHNLLKVFGGVPIITMPLNVGDNLFVSRNTFDETVSFIVEEADRAADLLPVQAREEGRTSKGAALALKARVLLYAASDLYNEAPANDLVGYVSGSQQARWEAARDAAQEVMDLGVYSLFDRYEDPVENYTQLFLLNEEHEESIMSRFFSSENDEGDDGYNPGRHNGPNGYTYWGGNTPTQSLVDTYPMTDGSLFDWNNPVHAATPYENRDPRFYATILYDGAVWRPRPPETVASDPVGIINTVRNVSLPNGNVVPGLDTRGEGVQFDWNGSRTGYYLRKFIDPSIEDHHSDRQEIPWRFFRYAEVLLNFAEASIELGDEAQALMAINQIRDRAGMPAVTASGQELVNQYRNERRIELAFESHRYWDIRRWKIAPGLYENVRGIHITANAEDYTDRTTYSNYQYRLTEEEIQERNWEDKAYFIPIHIDEIRSNQNLVQNPFY